ncbi:MAG: response regulator [Eubacterium sp.]|nr:response regulator [Eubacterium sp.]
MRVLIVDDDRAITESLSSSVNWRKLGITDVETAGNAQQAKRILKEKETDIVISDIEMPKESGLDLLKWYREEDLDGKFLLLTSYENFYYAKEAVKLHAEEYLMKPYHVDMMEMVLQKIIQSLKQERQSRESGAYRKWMINNAGELKLNFWYNLFSGRISHTQDTIERELEKRSMVDVRDRQFCLVISRITNMEQDIDAYGKSLVQFILENLHSELLCGVPQNDSVVYFEQKDCYSFAAVCDEQPQIQLKAKCRSLILKCEKLLSSTVTCCISNLCHITEFYEVYHRIADSISKNVLYYGDVFTENQTLVYSAEKTPVMQMDIMDGYLEKHDKKAFLNYTKKELDRKTEQKLLDGEMIQRVHHEIQQAVYVYLAKRGIQISLLLIDDISVRLSEKAGQSVVDLIRWENYLLGHVFAYEKELQKSQTIIEKINDYVHKHYKENIGRNEIGAHFFLVPEYLAKVYKKNTGQTLKDYINGYRLQQAKLLLGNMDMRVSDVALEVGFDNFSYFSTLFKKEYGITPNEYRKNLSGYPAKKLDI